MTKLQPHLQHVVDISCLITFPPSVQMTASFGHIIIIVIIIIILRPITSTKSQAEILKLNKVNGCNDISFGDRSILEGDRIPPLKSHGQALEEELFPWSPQ